MPHLRRPSLEEIEARLATGRSEPLSYAEQGASESLPSPPASLAAVYNVDHYAFGMGQGAERFARAGEALLAWRHFDIPWIEFYGASAPAAEGQVVATLVPIAGLWFLNPCRVVYVRRSESVTEFAYGTLYGHPERGEERFRVVCDAATQAVRFEIDAFSRPALLLTRLGAPFARRVQRRFAKSAAAALAAAVS